MAPWLVTFYLTALQLYSEEWKWISEHKPAHETAFRCLFGITMGVLFLRGLTPNAQPLDASEFAREVLENFISTVGSIVNAKTQRFRKAIPKIRPNSDRFHHITKPQDQIPIIAAAMSEFIRTNYGLNEDQIDITILRRKPGGNWHYFFEFHRWNHTGADVLMEGNSAAAFALATGEAQFLPDKIAAAANGQYVLSRRDKRRGDGSAFVFPISVKLSEGEMSYVVSIITYEKQLCYAYESQTREITAALLSEICRRFELELCLEAISSCC